MQIERACADIEVFDLKTAYLGRSHSLLICPPNEYVTAISGGYLIQCGGPNGLTGRLTQGASGTPSMEGMLNNPLGTYFVCRKYKSSARTTNCIVFGTACLCLCLHSFPV